MGNLQTSLEEAELKAKSAEVPENSKIKMLQDRLTEVTEKNTQLSAKIKTEGQSHWQALQAISRSAEDLDRTSTVRYKKILDRLFGTKKKV